MLRVVRRSQCPYNENMNLNRIVYLAFFSSSVALAAPSVAVDVTLTPAGSFSAKSVAVDGHAYRVGDIFAAKNVVLKVATLKTGIDLRDNHMRDKYFEAGKYPEAKLVQASGKAGNFWGDLSVHGITY